jgi:phosphoribosylaminoimidazolecarboxamide formyltransferase/IMP cyclohydrolase
LISIKRALLSAYDKEGLPELAEVLSSLGVELVSSGGTAAALRERGLNVVEVGDLTGSPEMLGGRVKTLHPKVFGGILYRRSHPGDLAQIEEFGVPPIDMVVVNFYPFERAAEAGGAMGDAEKAELIDIGGPCMVRAAAKNWAHVLVLTDPGQYERAARRISEGGGAVDEGFSRGMAVEAFRRTCSYDLMIADALEGPPGEGFPLFHVGGFRKVTELRYGENPHQRAALYVNAAARAGLAAAEPLHGKALSFNNILDIQAAWGAVSEFTPPACVVVKHRNPCGVATGEGPAEAFARARDADSLSAFGGVVAFNGKVDGSAATALADMFLECVVAPDFTSDALERLMKKKNLRLLRLESGGGAGRSISYPVDGGLLLEECEIPGSVPEMKTVTRRGPTGAELDSLTFSWLVAKHVTSNAIVLSKGGVTLGIGSGQTSRIDALNVAIMKAARQGAELKGSAMASDGFFPFRDCVDRANEVGVTAIVEPGGSVRDQESIDAADEHGVAMVFTGRRCFKH